MKVTSLGSHTCKQEVSALSRIIHFCTSLRDHMPSSLGQDRRQLSWPASDKEGIDDDISNHQRLALEYRIARKELLDKVIEDLTSALILLSE